MKATEERAGQEQSTLDPHPSAGTASRERILEAATRLFVSRGYRGQSMREIAEAVGISKPAIYHHFKDKEELFVAILSAYLDQLDVLIQASMASETTCHRRVTQIVEAILRLPPEIRAVSRLASQEMVHLSAEVRAEFNALYYRQFIGPLVALFEEGVCSGELRSMNPTVATWTFLGMLTPFIAGSQAPGLSPEQENSRQVLDIFFLGSLASVAADR